MLEILLAEFHQIALVIIQFQVGRSVDRAAVPVQIHGKCAAFRRRSGQRHDRRVAVSLYQDLRLGLFVFLDGELVDGRIAVPVSQSGGVCVPDASFAAAHRFQPVPCLHIHVQPGFDERRVHHDRVVIVAADIVIRHGAKQGDLSPVL